MHFFVDKKIPYGSITPARLATIGSDPERLKLKFSSLRFRRRSARGDDEMQNFSVVAEIRKGFARRGPLGFGDGDSQGFPTFNAEGLRMETEITRDRYFCEPSFYPILQTRVLDLTG